MSRMTRPAIALVAACLILPMLLGACAKSAQPQGSVEAFLKALLSGDEDAVFNTVCPDWESQAAVELDAFSGVTGHLDGAQCFKAGMNGADTLIACTGTMVLDYQGEERSRPLEGQTYLVRKINGDWKMCGYR